MHLEGVLPLDVVFYAMGFSGIHIAVIVDSRDFPRNTSAAVAVGGVGRWVGVVRGRVGPTGAPQSSAMTAAIFLVSI